MSRIQLDPFWDRPADGVRCSSEGPDAERYISPEHQSLEDGRTLAAVLPPGPLGVVIPRATTTGASRGFDPQKPGLITIDPEIAGQSCTVDLSKVTKEMMREAYDAAASDPQLKHDRRLVAAQTYHYLAQMCAEVQQRPPYASKAAQHAPRADDMDTRPFREDQQESYPAQRARMTDQSSGARSRKPPKRQGPPPQAQQPAPAPDPLIGVTFEMQGWGSFEAAYHEVIKKDDLIVLVYDNSFRGGMKWMPPATQNLMAVRVAGEDTVYFVNSLGTQFSHGGYDYALLVVSQETDVDDELDEDDEP